MSVSIQVSDIQNIHGQDHIMDVLRSIIRNASKHTQHMKHAKTVYHPNRIWVFSHHIIFHSDNTISFDVSMTKYDNYEQHLCSFRFPFECFVNVETLISAIYKFEADRAERELEAIRKARKAERYARYMELRAEFEPRWMHAHVSTLDTFKDYSIIIK